MKEGQGKKTKTGKEMKIETREEKRIKKKRREQFSWREEKEGKGGMKEG